MQLRRLLATTALALVAATSLAACGEEETSNGKTEGVYVTTGDLKYQVQISRQLNPHDFEDHDYLVGRTGANANLKPNEDWFGVFLRVRNTSDAPHQSASRFYIEDTTGQRFDPVTLNQSVNVVAYKPLVVGPGDQLPVPGSLARENPTQGGLVLFKVPVSSFANRPLVLHIEPAEGGQEATVDLDV
ncbi:MAG TPA: hypothetical protein VFT50_05970 [Baekduia sp.]|nr:hypothetical protein [Baekduia sp.]